MDRQHLRQLAARFIAEAEADINYGLAEDLDPRRECERLVARLHREDAARPAPAAQRHLAPTGGRPSRG